MGKTWIVAANRSNARIFEVERGTDTPREIEDLVDPAGRAHERDLTSDAAGRFYGKGERNQGHSAGPEASQSQHEVERFAIQIRDYLDRAHAAHRFEQLWVIAAPAFLGALRTKLSKAVTAALELEVDKDVPTHTPREIFELALSERAAKAAHRAAAER